MYGEKVLVVDDSPTDLSLMVAPLRESGFQVITAVDGEEAIEKAVAEHPRVIVLDVVLPKRSGFQVCRTLRSHPECRDIPIILLTSKRQEFDRFWGLRQGANHYLTKPFGGDVLVANVTRLL